MSQPNILFITVDQMRFDHLGMQGVSGIKTPNLDRLGQEGVLFNRAYSCSPVCTPARLSLLTGQYPSSHGGYSIGVSVNPFPERTLPSLLGKAGYATALFGKAHFVSRDEEAQHFSGQAKPPSDFFRNHSGPYVGFQEAQIAVHHTTNGVPQCHYQAWLEDLGVDYSAWYPDCKGGHDHAQTGVWDIPVKYHDSTWITNTSIDFIRRQSYSKAPWFCWTSYNDPHEPFVCPEPWYSQVNREAMEIYEGYRKGEFQDKPPFYSDVYQSDEALGGWPEDFRNEKNIQVPCAFNRKDLKGKEREALQATLGMVAMLDHEVGRLLDTLENTEQADNTVVVFTCDHGELHGHHGLWHKGLFAYEDSQRVPFLVWSPGRYPARGKIEALANLVDLPRTFLSIAGLPVPQGMQGKDLTPVLEGVQESVQDFTLIEMQATRKIYQQTLITAQHKLVLYRDQNWGELYDLSKDPDQYENLWNREESRELQMALLHKMAQCQMEREGHAHDRIAFA